MSEKKEPSEGCAAPSGALLPGQRWSLARKREVALRLLRGESIDALSRELGVEIYRLERWRDRALAGLDAGLAGARWRSGRRPALRGDAPHPASCPSRTSCCDRGSSTRARHPVGGVEAMSAAISIATGRPYGVRRVLGDLGRGPLHLLRRPLRPRARTQESGSEGPATRSCTR